MTDKKLMEADLVFKKGFILRVSILPMKTGEAALWLSIAPGTKESVKAEAEKKGMTEYDARVPTLEVTLGTTATGPQVTVNMGPMEGDWMAKGWGNYPLIMVNDLVLFKEGLELNIILLQKLDDQAYPSDRLIWRELTTFMRSVEGHTNRSGKTFEGMWSTEKQLEWSTKTVFTVADKDK